MPAKAKPAARRGTADASTTAPVEASAHPQHPAWDGDPDREVAQRSPDGAVGGRYVKQFVIMARDFDPDAFDHRPNVNAMVVEARNQGVRPAADEVVFEGAEPTPAGRSLTLTYSMAAIPAVIAGHGGV